LIQYDRYLYEYSYIIEKYGLFICYTNDASYYYHTDSKEFLDPHDISLRYGQWCITRYSEEEEQSNTVSKWGEILPCLVSHRLPRYHGGCTNISEFVLGI